MLVDSSTAPLDDSSAYKYGETVDELRTCYHREDYRLPRSFSVARIETGLLRGRSDP